MERSLPINTPSVSPEMHEKICDLLERKEIGSKNPRFRILIAAEQGSRAWGIPNERSDYDIKFIYSWETRDYLDLFRKWDDTVSFKDDKLNAEFMGWSLPKALRLMAVSNPHIWELIKSPHVYMADDRFMQDIEQRLPECFGPKQQLHAYRGVAVGNFKRYIEGKETFELKKLLQVLRCVLVFEYILETGRPCLLGMRDLMAYHQDRHTFPIGFHLDAERLVKRKANGQFMGEGDWSGKFMILLSWLRTHLPLLEALANNAELAHPNKNRLNDLFRAHAR